MKRRTIARLIAVFLLGYLFALAIVSSDKSDMVHYRTLSRDALITELAKKNDGDFDGNFFVGILIIGSFALLVDGLGWVVLLAINRISPPPPHAMSEPDGLEETGAPRFH